MPKVVTIVVFNLLKLKGILTEAEVNLITKLQKKLYLRRNLEQINVNL